MIGEANPDGTANLVARNLPPYVVVAALERVNRLAREAKTEGDDRSIDQIRADVFSDLVTGRGLSSAGSVDVTVDLRHAVRALPVTRGDPRVGTGHVRHRPPGGYGQRAGPVEDGGHRRRERAVVWNGTTRRQPSVTEPRYLLARQAVCVFPGCRMPARDSDLDHTVDYAKGGAPTRTTWDRSAGIITA